MQKNAHNNNTSNNIYNTSSLRSEVLCDERSFEENSEDSTKAKFGQNLEAEKLVRKTSRVSNQEENEQRAKLQEFLKKSI